MNEQRFVRERLEHWEELRAALAALQRRGARRLDGAAIRRIGVLYRGATSDLASARTLELSEETQRYLNRLCSVAHDQLYARRRRGPGGRLLRFVTTGFPRAVARTWKYHAACAAALFLAGLVAFLVFRDDPDLLRRTMGPGLFERAERSAAIAADQRRYLDIQSPHAPPVFGFGVIANNVHVTLAAFATGILFGLAPLLVMIFNGVHIGGAVAVYHQVGVPALIWTFMAAHGPIELTAIFIAGGAGMRYGLAFVLPGRRRRAVALRDTAAESVVLLGGTAMMLLVAGTLEGFVSPSLLPPVVKIGVGALTAVLLLVYFGIGFQLERRAAAESRIADPRSRPIS